MWTLLLLAMSAPAPSPNVVLITWDGVRREDFRDPERLPHFWNTRAGGGLVLGGPSGPGMSVADPRMASLPSYQSIFVGALTDCRGNDCDRVREETFPERLVRELSLSREEVAVFASWAPVATAVEHRSGTIAVDAGPHCFLPWRDSRKDEETVALAQRYLGERRPRFLYLSLGDADEWAHAGNLLRYRETLLRYDEWLEALLRQLESMGDYGSKTTVIVTTDHGRGDGAGWTAHPPGDPHARSIWLIARGPGVKPGVAGRAATHLDLRPTIEALFGLCSAQPTIEEIAPPACGQRQR